uniref:Small ribosomal subunit protein bS16c n=1 Tax=Dictyopteris divaricata TaxID=156996 RepID=A0A2I4Q2M7_9PHAE|nr:30S ribosomal protein S16 [Dictyopteris divaricata]YP_010205387.1 30S ribosomal protein S16 [Grateloupia livida]AQZ25098.1 30S ribosomal protein S16 [Dictyopteris divaricata]UAV85956.1 30S ribosomal protein S16 [Grateloupia livida]
MLKIRFKRGGRKKHPFYRIVVINNRTKRDGKVIEELGSYNPLTKIIKINLVRTIIRLEDGAQPTEVVKNLFRKSSLF